MNEPSSDLPEAEGLDPVLLAIITAAKDAYQKGTLIFPCVQVQRDYENIDDIIRMCRRRIRAAAATAVQ